MLDDDRPGGGAQMTENFTIRPYHARDEAEVLAVWNSALFADPINATTFRAKVLLDPNFDRETCLVAEQDGEVSGFVLGLRRRVPFFGDGYEPDQSWISAFGVAPQHQGQGIGSALLERVLTTLQELGAQTTALSPYVPNYFTPGADANAYAAGIEFMTRRGFEVVEEPISMRAELTGFQIPEEIQQRKDELAAEGVEIRPATPDDIVPVLDFIPRHFSWDWHREASGVLMDLYSGDPRWVNMIVAREGDEVLGYAEHRGERFGPFGVHTELRSRGIGRVLLATCLLEMLKKNYHAAWFLWTEENAARLYSQLGFEPVRRFAVLKKDLATGT
jgi:ribosomal protein S18 acetylase RimI-like enzyme